VIDVPKELNEEQRSAVEELSKSFNGNPRARLFAAGAATSGSDAQEGEDGTA